MLLADRPSCGSRAQPFGVLDSAVHQAGLSVAGELSFRLSSDDLFEIFDRNGTGWGLSSLGFETDSDGR